MGHDPGKASSCSDRACREGAGTPQRPRLPGSVPILLAQVEGIIYDLTLVRTGRLAERDPGPARGPPAAPTAPPRRSTCSSRRSSGSATASATSPTTGCACCCTAASPGRLTGPRDCEAAPTLRGVEPVKSARLVVRPCTVHPLRMGLGSATWPMLGECDRGALRRPSWPYARAGHAETSVDRDMRRT
jgi:hypothetical protein